MDILIKNLQEKHLPLFNELAKLLDFEITEVTKKSNYDLEFVAKIAQGDQYIKAGRTTLLTLDEISEEESILKGLEDAKTVN